MRILLSAFACAPNTGSEAGGGWMYAVELAKTHDVWVLTDESRRSKIEPVQASLPATLRIVYFRPPVLRRLTLNSKTAHLIYQVWQMQAWRVARALDAEHNFDVCWHLTYGVFRQPSWMWKVGKPFVFGPVGGGERAPMRLWKGMPWREQLRELMRDVANQAAWWLPGLRATYRHAHCVIARTEDTRQILPRWAQAKTAVQQEIGGYAARAQPADRPGHNGHLRVLFVGRLLGWKGVHLALPAFANFLQAGGSGHFTIVGEGPMAAHLRQQVRELALAEHVSFKGHVQQTELFAMYPQFDVMLFPSLHDSGGNAVLESLSFGLPVICLDLGGPRCFVDEASGWVVSTQGATTQDVERQLTSTLLAVQGDAAMHRRKCHGAMARAAELTWPQQIQRVMALVQTTVMNWKKTP